MELMLLRYAKNEEATHGLMMINDKFECYSLEDEERLLKIKGETRIPQGRYQIKERREGGMYDKYKERYPNHKGMLHLQDVPGFKYIYIHIGNDDQDTQGCILVGNNVNNMNIATANLYDSTRAYLNLYVKLIKALESGEEVYITIRNEQSWQT